jgi:cell division protein FtsB
MAVIGARPATGIEVLLRRPRTRPHPPRRVARGGGRARRRETRSISGLLVVIAAAAALAFFYLSQAAHVATTGYQIDALQTRVAELRREQQQLVFQIGQARAPAQIETRARTELHLVPIDQAAVSFARDGDPSVAFAADRRHAGASTSAASTQR